MTKKTPPQQLRLEYSREQCALFWKGTPLLVLDTHFFAAARTRMDPKIINGRVLLNRKTEYRVKMAPQWDLEETANGIYLRGTLQDKAGTGWSLCLREEKGGLSACLEMAPSEYTQMEFSFAAAREESFYGFGEQYSHLDLNRKAFRICVDEQGIGRGRQPVSALVNLVSKKAAGDAFSTYAPMALFVTSRKRGAVFLNHTIYHFDIQKKRPGTVTVQVPGNRLEMVWFWADTPLELIEKHTALTGRLSPLPDFAYQTILGLRGGKETVEKILAECLRRGTPVGALWIEDWEGRRGKNGGPPLWWRWFPDQQLYPDFKNWANELRERKIALLGYANPFLSVDEKNPLYQEAAEKGYLVKNDDGTDYIQSFYTSPDHRYCCVDLTNPQAYDWLKETMRRGMLEEGLSGWMADYGEYTPLTGKTHNQDPVRAHCELPVLWAKLNRELIQQTGNQGKALIFHRSANVGSSRYAVSYWAGDQNPTLDKYDGLASSITGLISSGISGMSINHTDIGGFTTIMTPFFRMTRKKEVMLRWLEYAAFTPIFRTHDGNYSNPLNYQFYYDEEGYQTFAKMAKLHSALAWYLKELEKEATEKGWPMVRALWLHYPDDPVCRKLQYQYLLGADLLVCPVYRHKATEVDAYVPKGSWISPYDGKSYSGNVRLPAPLGRPAVLVRRESSHAARLIQCIQSILL